MKTGGTLRLHWPEMLLALAVAIPWLSLLALGSVWLWQSGLVWAWALAAVALSIVAWPLLRLVRRRANAEARLALGDMTKPSHAWGALEREAWSDVSALADGTAPFSFTEIDPLVASARQTVEAVAHRFHPKDSTAWANFTLPEILLLTERVSQDLRQEALRTIPGARDITLSRVLWIKQQFDRYGPTTSTAWRIGHGIWRLVRLPLNPVAAVGQEVSRIFTDKTLGTLSLSVRASLTQKFVHEVGRAAIDLYSGRLALSDAEMRTAQACDAAVVVGPAAPVRLVLAGQVNAGKSSLVNALAQETRSAVGPLPTTARATEYRLDLEGRPAVSLVDMPGLGADATPELLEQVDRADLVVWVAAATQPAREIDRQGLDDFRAWARAQLKRRPPPVVLALTHIDELRPANAWAPPYDVVTPAGPKARAIRSAIDAVASALDLPADAIVPVAMAPGREPYNLDALWSRIALELDEAKLVQLDRLRVGQGGVRLSELAHQLGNAGRMIVKGIIRGS